jgi:UrcA family protein
MRRSILLTISAAAIVVATPAMAKPVHADTQSQKVSVADLDLTSARGANRFLNRVQRTARRVCGGRPDGRAPSAERAAFRECVSEAMQNAVVAINSPAVYGQFAARGGQLEDVVQASLLP